MLDPGSASLTRLLELVPDAVIETHARLGDATALVHGNRLAEVMTRLRDDIGFDMLMDVTAVDYLGREPRFEMVYHLLASDRHERLRVKAGVPEKPAEIASLIEVWPSANWLEREVWDMYGIRFVGHPDPRRLLLYEEFEGHPLRKDYAKERRQPLVGPRN